MSFFSSIVRSVKKETNRFLDRRVGIDDPVIRSFLNPLEIVKDPGKRLRLLGGGSGEEGPLDPLEPFSLPTNFELSSARGELQSVLRKKRARAKVSFTGGLQGGAGVAPRLTTA